MFFNIPLELRVINQWVCWRYEAMPDGRKTKVPYSPNGQHKADVNKPHTWGSFDDAVAGANSPAMSGIGFVLTSSDPYTGIDIDNKPENPASPEELLMHQKILDAFQSYTEKSVGGSGFHIIIKGKINGGRDRGHVGVYSTQRYLTFTGDVVRAAPIAEYQNYLDQLVAGMPDTNQTIELQQIDSDLSDLEIHEMASRALNADKYNALCCGHWQQLNYPSQSEADLALLSILAFYTKDNEQCRRMFRYSVLGKRDKATRDNKHIDRTLRRIRANEVPPADIEAAKRNAETMLSNQVQPVPAPIQPTPAIEGELVAPIVAGSDYTLPPGLIGELASYFYSTSTRPLQEAALAAAISIVAGVIGRSYNISGTGLNQYILFLGKTGTGKEGMAKGISKLFASVRKNVPMISDFIGPSSFASGQGLIRVLDQRPCFVSVLGEFGLTLQALSDPRAPAAQTMLRKVLLDLYGKSGWDDMLQSTAYSDQEKNTKIVHAPNVTILAESTPETFYDGIDAGDIADGLIPRFHIIEYKGQRPNRNKTAGHAPNDSLVKKFSDLAAIALTTQNNNSCAAVQIEPAGLKLLDRFDLVCDKHIRDAHNAGESQLWNRAHLKALKLSALLAVGVNPHAPVVTADIATWAIEFTQRGTDQILKRFFAGDIGNGENKQQAELRRVIELYFNLDSSTLRAFKCSLQLQKKGLVPYSYLITRLSRIAAFYRDRQGTAKALKNALQTMVDSEQLGFVTPVEAFEKYNLRQNLYYLGNSW